MFNPKIDDITIQIISGGAFFIKMVFSAFFKTTVPEDVHKDVIQVLIKTIIPATVAVCVSVAVQMKEKKITIISAILSLIIGVGTAWICSDVIHASFSPKWATVSISLIAICGDKVAHWLIFEFNFTPIAELLLNKLKRWLR